MSDINNTREGTDKTITDDTQPRDILLSGVKPNDIGSAERIELKRLRKRKERLCRLKRCLAVVILVLGIGFTGYAVTEISMLTESSSSKADASEAPKQIEHIYNCFARVGTSSLELSLPGRTGDVLAIGFHEAERREAVAITPAVDCFNRETTTTVRNAIIGSEEPVLFIMDSRGRRSAPTSAVDVAMVPYAEVLSPVDGVVTVVKTYSLYNKLTDYHVEIQPDGYPDLRVAIIHIDNVQVEIGQRVKRREAIIGLLRPLPQIKHQINKYLPEPADHVHIQVNPVSVDGDIGS